MRRRFEKWLRYFCLHYLRDLIRAVDKLYQHLKPGQSGTAPQAMHTSKGNLTIYHSYSSLAGSDDQLETFESAKGSIRFEHSDLPLLPPKLIEKIPKVSQFEARHVNLREIGPRTFVGAERLKILDLSGNLLCCLPQDVFKGARNLQELNLSDNQIASLDPGVFADMAGLASLNLANNRLAKLPIDVFGRNRSLSRVDLRDNAITDLDSGTFLGNPALVKISLSRNRLAELTLELPNNSLSILDVTGNQLSRLDLWSGAKLSGPKLHLLAAQNQLSSLLIMDFSVKLLNLASNALHDLAFLDSVEFEALSWLDVSHNQLKRVKFEVIRRRRNLHHLAIEGNDLQEFPPEAAHSRLRELHLQNNRIQHFPTDNLLLRFPRLTNLDLRGNDLDSLSKIELSNRLGYKVLFDGILATVESFEDLLDQNWEDSFARGSSDEFDQLSISERDLNSSSSSTVSGRLRSVSGSSTSKDTEKGFKMVATQKPEKEPSSGPEKESSRKLGRGVSGESKNKPSGEPQRKPSRESKNEPSEVAKREFSGEPQKEPLEKPLEVLSGEPGNKPSEKPGNKPAIKPEKEPSREFENGLSEHSQHEASEKPERKPQNKPSEEPYPEPKIKPSDEVSQKSKEAHKSLQDSSKKPSEPQKSPGEPPEKPPRAFQSQTSAEVDPSEVVAAEIRKTVQLLATQSSEIAPRRPKSGDFWSTFRFDRINFVLLVVVMTSQVYYFFRS